MIAVSFAEIFFGNSTGIGMLCVCATMEQIETLAAAVEADPKLKVNIDLESMTVSYGEITLPVTMPESNREIRFRSCLRLARPSKQGPKPCLTCSKIDIVALLVSKPRSKPFFGFIDRPVFALGVVLDLIFLQITDGEILALGV